MNTEAKLIEMGFDVWEAYGKKRIYINVDRLHEVFNFSVNFYGTGNVSSASLNGEKISNGKAKKMLCDKVFYCCQSNKFFGNAELIEAVKI